MKISARGVKPLALAHMLLTGLGFSLVGPAANAAPPPKPHDVGSQRDLLTRGDHNDSEILRFRRIRVERQEVIVGQSGPVLCRHGNALLLTGAAGRLVRSRDGGKSWERCGQIPVGDGEVRALAALRSGAILAAVHRGSEVSVLSSPNGTQWQPIGRVTSLQQTRDPIVDLIELHDAVLLLGAAGQIHRSSDGGKTWTKPTDLPTGWTAARFTQLSSGKLMAAVLFEGPALGKEKYHNTFLAESSDRGNTWSPARGVTRRGQIPGSLAELPDGRLVLTYGEESFPYGARALVSTDGGTTWGTEVYVLGLDRYGPRAKPRPFLCEPASGAASVVLDDGVIVAAFDRGKSIKPTDDWGTQSAILIVRWRPEGMKKPLLVYPNLWTDKVDARGYLDNGWVRMRPDDRYEGGDYVENYEMVVYRRLPAQQRYFPGMGTKGVVVCRHADGSLILSSRDPSIYRSNDEGHTWNKVAVAERSGKSPSTFGFGVTGKGTFLVGYDTRPNPGRRPHIARSEDGGKSWQCIPLEPGPMKYGGGGDGSRIRELSDGTIIMSCGNAWMDPERRSGYGGDVILRSRDDGKTWGDWTVLPPGSCESNFLEFASGVLLCATRLQRNGVPEDLFDGPGGAQTWQPPSKNLVGPSRFKNEAIMFSSDRGYNWTTPTIVTRIHMVSADVALSPDGRVVLTYDHKDAVGGARALVSPDGGQTWESEAYILSYHTLDARTSSVVLNDGRILTLWAGSKDQGIHATVWLPE